MKKRNWVTGLGLGVAAVALVATGCGAGADCPTPRAAPGRPVPARSAGPTRPAATPARRAAPHKPVTMLQAARVICRANKRELAQIVTRKMARPRVLGGIMKDLADYRRLYGPCLRVQKEGRRKVLFVHGATGIISRVIVTPDGRLGGLWFSGEVPMKDSLAAVTRDLRALKGDTAITVRQAGSAAAILRLNATKPLAVASAFKLSVLKTVIAEIKARRLRWRDTVALRPGPHPRPHFPMGFLPAGAMVTVESLATFMITFSDNAATDQLVAHLGRAKVERHIPRRNLPLLTTVEMTKLKHPTLQTFADQFMRAKTVAQRRKVLRLLASRKMPTARRRGKPRYIRELEWFYTTDELCSLILELRSVRLFAAVQKRKRPTKQWARLAFKGGGEPGVKNLTYALQRKKDQRWYCISATWNRPGRRLKGKKLRMIVRRLMRLLGKMP